MKKDSAINEIKSIVLIGVEDQVCDPHARTLVHVSLLWTLRAVDGVCGPISRETGVSVLAASGLPAPVELDPMGMIFYHHLVGKVK